MAIPSQPRLRRVDGFPVKQPGGQVVFALRDPEGFSGSIVLPYAAAAIVSLMDGSRTLEAIQRDYAKQFGRSVEIEDIADLVRQLDDRAFLDTDTFRARWKAAIEGFLNSPVRPAAHAGGAYAADPEALSAQLAALFTHDHGPGAIEGAAATGAHGRLCGVLSPHIDLDRGGPTFAWAYKQVIERSDADLFVIFGTCHTPMRNLFALTKKHFDTPLGTVETDKSLVAKLAQRATAATGDRDLNLFADELSHRSEHSIEFQVVFLQYLLGNRRPFKILPVLTGSFHNFVEEGASPGDSKEVAAFVSAMRDTVAEHAGKVLYISGADLAHIGQRFGDRALLDRDRLKALAEDDRALLTAACRPDAEAFFSHVARQQDCNRICGLSPTYTMLEVMRPGRGELLRYDQAVELDGTSCVSFAAAAFYDA
jgi:AmmeMemoRadiSam system protein B